MKCKSCGAEIVWIKMKSGKSMPCNPDQVVYWQNARGSETIVTPNGEVVKASLTGFAGAETGVGYISHFATCPDAEMHRRR